MKVLHIFNEIKFSGAEIMYANAASFFQKNNIEMTALATGNGKGDFEPVFIENGIKIIHKPIPSRKNKILYVNEIVTFINENNFEVMHIHRANVKWLFALIAKKAGIKSVYTVHNVFKNRKITWIKGFLERYTARKWLGLQFQTIGPSVYENEINYYKTPSIRINNWYDDGKFYPPTSTLEIEHIRKKLKIPNETYVLISIGGCSYVKNHHDILKAIPLIKYKQILYLHLGCGVTEAEEKELAKELGIEDKVIFLGNKNNVRDYLIASNLYLMSSVFEGLGMATVEAMASNLPSVLYNAPGSRDLIKNNDNGLLIEQDYTKLAESIDWMIQNKEDAKKMGNAAVRFVNEEFNLKENVLEIIKLYYK